MEGMENMNISKHIRELIDFLNQNTKYYDEGKPHITDKDWDKIYFELESLEDKTGIIYPDSPTQSIFYDTVSKLNKKVVYFINKLLLNLRFKLAIISNDILFILDNINRLLFSISNCWNQC